MKVLEQIVDSFRVNLKRVNVNFIRANALVCDSLQNVVDTFSKPHILLEGGGTFLVNPGEQCLGMPRKEIPRFLNCWMERVKVMFTILAVLLRYQLGDEHTKFTVGEKQILDAHGLRARP